MSPYRSLVLPGHLPTDRPSALGTFLQPLAEGFAGGLEEDRLRRRKLADEVTAYRTLMPLKLDTFRQEHEILGRMQEQRDAAALQKALRIKEYERATDPQHQARTALAGLVTQPIAEHRPAGQPFPQEGTGEAMGRPESWTGRTSVATTSPGVDPRFLAALAIQAKVEPKDLQSLLRLGGGGLAAQTPQASPGFDLVPDYDEYGQVKGYRQSRQPRPPQETERILPAQPGHPPYLFKGGVAEPIPGAPAAPLPSDLGPRPAPLSSEWALAAKAEGLDPEKYQSWTPQEAERVRRRASTSRGEDTEARTRQRIQAEAAMAESIRRIAYARASGQVAGRFDPSLPLSPAQNQAFGTPQGTTWKDVQGMFSPGQKARLAVEELRVSENLANTLAGLADRLITANDWVSANLQGAQLTAGAWSRANEDAAVFADQREALLGVLSRQVGAERGVLTDRDIYRIDKMLPNFRDTKAIKDKKLAFLRSMISANRDARLKSISALLDSAGNAWEFQAAGGAATPGGPPPAASPTEGGGGASQLKPTHRYNPATGKIEALP